MRFIILFITVFVLLTPCVYANEEKVENTKTGAETCFDKKDVETCLAAKGVVLYHIKKDKEPQENTACNRRLSPYCK